MYEYLKTNYLYITCIIYICITYIFLGNKLVAYAEDDILEDEADVEGEVDVDEVSVTEEEEEQKSTASPDADTTVLFVKPTSLGTSPIGIILS